MKTFIDSVAGYLLEKYKNLTKVTIIFPNRRPALFLLRSIGERCETPVFAPTTYSIRDFIYTYSNLNKADNITLLFRLYRVYCNIHSQESLYAFEHFISSGELMLADFNDIDNYMVNPSDLFSNLDKAKAIEQWNPGKHELTEFELQYLEFYQKLYDYYRHFTTELLNEGLAYDGLAYRTLAEKILLGNEFIKYGHQYIFAGFNALNAAEKIIIDHFVSKSGGELIWDADISYVDDDKQEAGTFLRANLQQWPNKYPGFIEDSLFSTRKNIHIIGAPLSLSQAKYAGQIAGDIFRAESNEIHNTVVVPADETMLPAILESIPEEIQHINVTMGYELKNSVIFRFIYAYIRLFSSSQKKTENKVSFRFSYNSLNIFISHPYFRYIFSDTNISFGEELIRLILERNKLFYTADELESLIHSSAQLSAKEPDSFISLLRGISTAAELNQKCTDLTGKIFHAIKIDDIISKNMISSLKEVLKSMHDYILKADFEIHIPLFELLFLRLTGNLRIPFEGEPLGGLQVMGFLETRCLDFKNVIITNVNEGFIPSGGKRMLTFIPFDLRKYFEMPLPAHKDAMYGYYFLRLLQRAQNIWILYNTEPDVFSGKEMSRYIRQIEYEFTHRAGNNWTVNHQILQVNVKPQLMDKKHSGVEKNNLVLEKIEKRFQKGFSSSSLYNYLECPFRFYLNYILDIKETDSEIAQSVEMDILGTVVHETLKEIYKPYINARLDNSIFDKALRDYKMLLDQQFEKHYPGGEMSTGKNLIILEVARTMIQNVLKSDIRQSEYETVIPICIENDIPAIVVYNEKTYRLYGKFDRVFMHNQDIRITDYKTGKVDSLRLIGRGQTFEDLDLSKLNNKKFQLLFYLLLYKCSDMQLQTKPDKIHAGIMPLRKFDNTFVPLEYSEKEKEIPESVLNDFKLFIFKMIDEIKNPDVPFSKTDDAEKCSFCIYKSVCNYFSPIQKTDNSDE